MSEIITVGLDLAKNMFSRCMDALLTLKFVTAALAQLEAEIGKLDVEIARRAKENELARRLMTVHSPMSLGPLALHWLITGPLIATAIATLRLVVLVHSQPL